MLSGENGPRSRSVYNGKCSLSDTVSDTHVFRMHITQTSHQDAIDCIRDAVKSILGDEVLESLFIHLETRNDLTRDEVPHRPDVFFASLKEAFGQMSGETIGRFIIKLFYARLGLAFDSRSNGILLDYVENARRKIGL